MKEKSHVAVLGTKEINSLREALQRSLARGPASRWNADPEDVQRSVLKRTGPFPIRV